jgi:protein-S-isoprenylcysteine O-methyltransferase Ste14
MGASWRTGIDPARPGSLVVDGPFALVRNPVYTAMIASAAGSALLAPTPLAPAALAACVAGLELQARAVEEPFLAGVHGARYRRYAARVGRFLPAIGRLPPS